MFVIFDIMGVGGCILGGVDLSRSRCGVELLFVCMSLLLGLKVFRHENFGVERHDSVGGALKVFLSFIIPANHPQILNPKP